MTLYAVAESYNKRITFPSQPFVFFGVNIIFRVGTNAQHGFATVELGSHVLNKYIIIIIIYNILSGRGITFVPLFSGFSVSGMDF